MTNLKKGSVLTIEIQDLAFGGKGISKLKTDQGELAVFVPNTIPKQKVKARIFKKRKNFIECKLLEVIEPSPLEVKLAYQPISGAPYLSLPIDLQMDYKQKNTLELFKRLGKIHDVDNLFDEYISSPSIFHYRNKMEYAFSQIEFDLEKNDVVDNSFALGSKRRGTWWMVESLKKDSGIFDQEFETKLNQIEQFLFETGLPAWHPPQKKGFFRYLTVRKSYSDNKLLINLTTSDSNLKEFNKQNFTTFISELFSDRLAGLLHTVNSSLGERANNLDNSYDLLYGENKIEEEILNLKFDISIQSFFQTNPKSAEKLYKKVIEYVLEDCNYIKDDFVLDLFCGTGTIGQLISKHTKCNVIGVDIVKEAIDNAKINAKKNNIETAKFYTEDVGKFLKSNPDYLGKIKTIILDPPRGGIVPKTLKKIIELGAKRIVYVSCNPATQSRDFETFFEFGYKLIKISLVDQFPHTAHIESVALLVK